MARRSASRRAWVRLSLAAGAVLAALLYLFPEQVALLRSRISVMRIPHASIEIIAFDERGNRLASTDFLRAWRPTLIVRDHTGAVCFGLQYGLGGPPRLAIPPAEPVSFELPWTVPGFGKVLLSADNRGHGYRVSAGAYTRIELIPELARSRLAQIERWIAAHNQGHAATDEVAQALAFTRNQLARMDTVTEPKERSILAVPALRAALEAGEREVLAEAANSISERRGGKLLVKVIDRHGTGVPNVKILVTETRAEFLAGANAGDHGYDADTIARLKRIGLNYASLDLNRAQPDPRTGGYSLDQSDRRFNPVGLKQNGFILRARIPAVSFDAAISFGRQPAADIAATANPGFHGQIAPIVKRYRDQVDIWQIDASPAAWPGFNNDEAAIAKMIKAAVSRIRKDDPDGRILINVAAPLGEDVAARYYPDLIRSRRVAGPTSADPYARLEFLSRAGVPYDLIGLEFDAGGPFDNADSRLSPPIIDLFRFALELERYAKLGKPLQITAIGAASSAGDDSVKRWWHADADEGTQADYLAGVLTIAYANPHVQAFNWAALYDANAIAPGDGLFDRSNRPKAALDRMASMLSGWRSNGQVTTGPDGTASFQGAAGDYQLSAALDSAAVTGVAHIHQGAADVAIMSVPATIVPPKPLLPSSIDEETPSEAPEAPEAQEVPETSEPFAPPGP